MVSSSHIHLSQLTKTFEHGNISVFSSLNVSFERGKIHSLIGPSGAGKSTLLRCLNGLERPDSGEIYINGQNLLQLRGIERRQLLQRTGTIFQRFHLLSRRTALENIMLPLQWQGLDEGKARERAYSLIEQVGLKGLEDRYPSALSGGQCQRVAIGRALSSHGELLLCDEFTSALDPETTMDILDLLRDLNQKLGITILLVTHDMAVVREVSDYVYVLAQGKLLEQGAFQQIMVSPQHPLTKSFLHGELFKELPPHVDQKIAQAPQHSGDHLLLRLVFLGEATGTPIIAELAREKGVVVNILAGGIHRGRETIFGSLLVSLDPGKDSQEEELLAYFSQNGVGVERLGYLALRDLVF